MDAEYLATGVCSGPSRYRAVFIHSMNNKATASSLVFAAVARIAARYK